MTPTPAFVAHERIGAYVLSSVCLSRGEAKNSNRILVNATSLPSYKSGLKKVNTGANIQCASVFLFTKKIVL
jgi:hypothetical protein